MIGPRNIEAARHAGANLWQLVAIASITLHVLVFFSDGIARSYSSGAISDYKYLQVRRIGFNDQTGLIFQQVQPVPSSEVIRAEWQAEIIPHGQPRSQPACTSDGGIAEYRQKAFPIEMSPAEWTGDPTCELVPGNKYRAVATWTWIDEDGFSDNIETGFSFTYAVGTNE